MTASPERLLLDATDKPCPYPVIVVGRYARDVGSDPEANRHVALLASDVAAKGDVPAWARMIGATIVNIEDVSEQGSHRPVWRFDIDLPRL